MNTVNNMEEIDVELDKFVNNKFIKKNKFVSSEFGITMNFPL